MLLSPSQRSHISGFTLIELSIVLVIVGLIVGGILVGRDLILNAGMRNIIKDIERYDTAVATFKLKYNALPGDMANATSIWGAGTYCATDFSAAPIVIDGTCNGNGDGNIGIPNTTGTDTFHYGMQGGSEIPRAWQHLALAGLIEGTYQGTFGNNPNGVYDVIGYTAPGRRDPRILTYRIWRDFIIPGGYDSRYQAREGHYIGIFPANDNYSGTQAAWSGGAFYPSEAYWIDLKVDDGLPNKGNVTALVAGGYAANCLKSGPQYDIAYRTTVACGGLVFRASSF